MKKYKIFSSNVICGRFISFVFSWDTHLYMSIPPSFCPFVPRHNYLKKLASKQKQAWRILNNEFTDIREIMVRMKVWNIYKLNICQILNFMFKIKANTAPCIFQNQFTEIQHQYSTRFSKNSFVESQLVYSHKIFCFITSTKTLEQTIRPTTEISGPQNFL